MERLPNEMLIDELSIVEGNFHRDDRRYLLLFALNVVCVFNNCKLEKGV